MNEKGVTMAFCVGITAVENS